MKAYRSATRGANGRYGLTFASTRSLIEGSFITLPCGGCIGCKIDRSRDWALRCHHEAQMHSANSFITLTYDDEHLPPDYGVHKRVWQLFMKRLRDKIFPTKVRFFASGEYTEPPFQRPHYHGLIFGYQFPDLVRWTQRRGNIFYRSQLLESLWTYGFSLVSDVTLQSSGYVARYIMKKQNGDSEEAALFYNRLHPITQKFHTVNREFCLSSNKPGLGSAWFDKYKSDAFPSDFLVVDGRKHSVPRYYTKKLEDMEVETYKRARKLKARDRRADNVPDRLAVRETLKKLQLQRLSRDL